MDSEVRRLRARFSKAATILLTTSSKNISAAPVYRGERKEKSTRKSSQHVPGEGPGSNRHSFVRREKS